MTSINPIWVDYWFDYLGYYFEDPGPLLTDKDLRIFLSGQVLEIVEKDTSSVYLKEPWANYQLLRSIQNQLDESSSLLVPLFIEFHYLADTFLNGACDCKECLFCKKVLRFGPARRHRVREGKTIAPLKPSNLDRRLSGSGKVFHGLRFVEFLLNNLYPVYKKKDLENTRKLIQLVGVYILFFASLVQREIEKGRIGTKAERTLFIYDSFFLFGSIDQLYFKTFQDIGDQFQIDTIPLFKELRVTEKKRREGSKAHNQRRGQKSRDLVLKTINKLGLDPLDLGLKTEHLASLVYEDQVGDLSIPKKPAYRTIRDHISAYRKEKRS